MHLFDEKDLFFLLKDEKLFSVFVLMEREKQILFAHVLHGHSFASIGAIFKISPQRVHVMYKRSLRKIKKQSIKILLEHKSARKHSPTWDGRIYIGGLGNPCYTSTGSLLAP